MPSSMSLADYLDLVERIRALRSRDELVSLLREISHPLLSPVDQRVLRRRLAAAASAVDPAWGREVMQAAADAI
jgi:hypothetical protein